MARRTRGQGDTIPQPDDLLQALGTCRKRVIDATIGVRPYGTAYHALHLVVSAIDTLAYYMTGQRDYYAIGGSVGPVKAEWE